MRGRPQWGFSSRTICALLCWAICPALGVFLLMFDKWEQSGICLKDSYFPLMHREPSECFAQVSSPSLDGRERRFPRCLWVQSTVSFILCDSLPALRECWLERCWMCEDFLLTDLLGFLYTTLSSPVLCSVNSSSLVSLILFLNLKITSMTWNLYQNIELR